MDSVFEIFALTNAAMDIGVMTPELISSVVLAIATFVTVQWTEGKITEAELRNASREMANIADRWRSIREQKGVGVARTAQDHDRRRAAPSSV
jgi:hypothetical protein